MDWRRTERQWGASNSESLWDELAWLWYHHHWLSPPRTRTAASNSKSATSSTGRRVVKTVMTRTVCIGGVCVMSEAWPGLWNIIYLLAPGVTLMVCSSVAVVKITIVNWMKYHGCDMHMMLRERESESVSGSPRVHECEHAVFDCWGTACTYVWVRCARCY